MFAISSGMFAQIPHDIWLTLNMKETLGRIVLATFLKTVLYMHTYYMTLRGPMLLLNKRSHPINLTHTVMLLFISTNVPQQYNYTHICSCHQKLS